MIFIDTTILISLLNKKDKQHKRTIQLMNILTENCMINNTVLNETMNSITAKNKHKLSRNLLSNLLNNFTTIYLNENDYIESEKIFDYYNQSINYSDCTILQTMMKKKINKIATYDNDFKKVKGITILK